MKQEDFVRFVVTDLYYLQEKIRDVRPIFSNPDLDEFFDKVPNGVKTRNDIISDLSQAQASLNRAHLALLSVSKMYREVKHVSA